MPDLMERMFTLLSAAPLEADTQAKVQSPKGESLLELPMPELNAPPRSYAQVYGPQERMLAQLSVDATAHGQPELATLLDTLDQGLRDGAFDVPEGPAPAPRLVRYVYPVV